MEAPSPMLRQEERITQRMADIQMSLQNTRATAAISIDQKLHAITQVEDTRQDTGQPNSRLLLIHHLLNFLQGITGIHGRELQCPIDLDLTSYWHSPNLQHVLAC